MKASIIISVYKNIEALRLILDSLRCQTVGDFEIIISEDGNDSRMSHFVETYNWFCPYQHLSQDDIGWRKNRALNRAILAAKSDWLIFLDGDCAVHYRFVEMHLHYAAPNRILLGKRVKLSQKLSTRLLSNQLSLNQLSSLMWFFLFCGRRGGRYIDEGLFIPFCLARPLRSTRSLTGCNMSFSREAILSINGFNEDYVRPAIGEDVDIFWRLKAQGYVPISVRNRAIAYHLYHKENWTNQDINKGIMACSREAGQVICLNGLNNHI